MFFSNQMIIRMAEVISTDDNYGAMRIKVRLNLEDGHITNDDDLPWCFPLLPKMLHVVPKQGELVLIFCEEMNNSSSIRFYIGPIISQPYFMYNESAREATRLFPGQQSVSPLQNPSKNRSNTGTLPELNDISIEGRYNSDIILKENELGIRCGYKKNKPNSYEKALSFNDKDFAYIQLKYKNFKDKSNNQTSDFHSVINVVADRINLISTNTLNQNKNDIDKTQFLTNDNDIENIVANAHPCVYGDVLIDFIAKLKVWLKEHTHVIGNGKYCNNESIEEPFKMDLSSMISKNVKIS